jgi:hypothetical protein
MKAEGREVQEGEKATEVGWIGLCLRLGWIRLRGWAKNSKLATCSLISAEPTNTLTLTQQRASASLSTGVQAWCNLAVIINFPRAGLKAVLGALFVGS